MEGSTQLNHRTCPRKLRRDEEKVPSALPVHPGTGSPQRRCPGRGSFRLRDLLRVIYVDTHRPSHDDEKNNPGPHGGARPPSIQALAMKDEK